MIDKKGKEVLKQNLEERFYGYMCYDQKAHKKFEDPSSKNAQYWGRVRQDAKRMSDLVIMEIESIWGK